MTENEKMNLLWDMLYEHLTYQEYSYIQKLFWEEINARETKEVQSGS